MTVVQGNNYLSGNILDNSNLGEALVNGEVIGRKVTFTKCYTVNAQHCINYTGSISENQELMTGNWHEGIFNQGKWEAHRQDDNLILELENVKAKTLQPQL